MAFNQWRGSWTKTTNPSQLHIITAVIQDTRSGKTSTWYAGTGEFRGSAGGHSGTPFTGDGIFKSTDGGVTWAVLPSTFSGTPQFNAPFSYIWNIILDASNSSQDEVYTAAYAGILRSVDGGNSWAFTLGDRSNFLESSLHTDIAISSTGVLYATLGEGTFSGNPSANRGIYRSPDGTNWTNITPAGWPMVYNRVVLGIAPSNENVV